MVTHNETTHRFEFTGPGGVAYLQYERRGNVIDLVHTLVPETMRGQGAAGHLAQAALEYARAEHLSVVPTCPFVKTYLDRHPEYQSLVSTIPADDDQI
jgi:hypothetical protein